jgi:hypothetical protein
LVGLLPIGLLKPPFFRRPHKNPLPLGFMHVPKTAGSALTAALAAALRPRDPRFVYDRVLFGTFREFETLSGLPAEVVCLSQDAVPAVDFLFGHVGLSTLLARVQIGQLMTVMREPVTRLISLWLFWRGETDERLVGWGAWTKTVRLACAPLGAFLSTPEAACQTDNQVTRMLLWPHPMIPDGGFIDERHDSALLRAAFARLSLFDFVGLVEDEQLVARLTGWLGTTLEIKRLNETAPLPSGAYLPLHEELDSDTNRLLERRTRLDLQLWLRVARRQVSARDAASLRSRVLLRSGARFGKLVSGS